jgi:cell division septal protein FtsQ
LEKKIVTKRKAPSSNVKNNTTSKNRTSSSKFVKPITKNVKIVDSPKKKKKKIKIMLTFFIIGILICIIYLLTTLSYFNVKSFIIEGNSKYTSEEISSKSGIQVGKNVFLQIFSGYKKKLSELTYIESVKAGVKFPNEIKLSITERKSIYLAYDKEKNRFFKIDANGYILEQSDITLKTSDELLVYGITFNDEVKFGEKINDTDISKLKVYNEIYQEFVKSGINGNITKVNFENSLTTITINDKLNVIFPNNTNLKYNMSFLVGIIEKIGEDAVGVIDMTKTNPIFSSF